MATALHIPLKKYLVTSYRPDCEYVDGEVRERNVGKWEHARVQWLLALWFGMHEKDWGIVGRQKAVLTAISMVGAILGGLTIGWLSDRIGRRRSIVGALAVALAAIPLWAFAHSLTLLVVGAVLMQFCVQGAWGVVPAHVSELSPDSVRGTAPGLGNQVGVLLSSSVIYLEAALAKSRTYGAAMAATAAVVFCLAAVMTMIGRERRGAELGRLGS